MSARRHWPMLSHAIQAHDSVHSLTIAATSGKLIRSSLNESGAKHRADPDHALRQPSPRPKDLLGVMKAKLSGAAYDADVYAARIRSAVADSVRMQVECGIDVPTDGEQGKPGFFAYVRERLEGFEPKPDFQFPRFEAETAAFPEYYASYMGQAMLGGAVAPIAPLVCTGPVRYRGQDAVRRDIDNLRAALDGLLHEDVFMPSVAPTPPKPANPSPRTATPATTSRPLKKPIPKSWPTWACRPAKSE